MSAKLRKFINYYLNIFITDDIISKVKAFMEVLKMEKYIEVNKMENYSEQIVKKKLSSSTVTSLVVSLCMITVIVFVSVFLSTFFGWLVPVAILLFALGIYIAYYMMKNSGIEYEYTFVLGEMRIDRIKGKTKRRKVTVFDVKSIDNMGKYIDPETKKKKIDASKFELVLRAAVNENSEDTYYVVIHDKIRQKPALLLFTPDDKTINMIRPYFSVKLKKQFLNSEI